MASRLEAIGVFLELGGSQILQDVHFALAQGEAAVLLGPSGVGKSSLLKVLAGLLRPSRGEVRLSTPQNLMKRGPIQSHSAWMAQQDLLLPWSSVLQNALPPVEGPCCEPANSPQEARDLLRSLGLAGWESRRPHELSQGMRQRVALVRTLMMKRPFLLLDEPCSALDAETRHKALELIAKQCQCGHCGVVMVSHQAQDAEILGARLWELEGGRLWPL